MGQPVKPRRTRYYEFSRVNPSESDFELLIGTCRRIDAYMGYTIFTEGGRLRLHGFVVLPHRDEVFNISRLFPNFMFKYIRCFMAKEEELRADSNAIFLNRHPFLTLRRKLTYLIPPDGVL